MAIKFNTFENSKVEFANAMKDGDEAQQSEAMKNMLDALAKDVQGDILNQVNMDVTDRSVMQARGMNVLTNEESKFFNAVIEDGGFNDEETLPKTTQERVFEDLVNEHPLLQKLGIQNLGAVTEFIHSDPEGAAVWGPLFGDIQGQLNATFRKETITQLKLTAFIPISNDMLDLGPTWVERYVRTMLVEAMSAGLERGFVAGDGRNQPVGLLYEVDEETSAITEKASAGTLTFEGGDATIEELKGVVELLSTVPAKGADGEDKVRNVAGKVVMVVNPFDNFSIQAKATVRNDAGLYITSLPFNPQIVESVHVPQGKTVFFVQGQYIAAVGGSQQMKKFDQTLAMEDATLYIAKQYATGKPVDNYAAQVYDLAISGGGVEG